MTVLTAVRTRMRDTGLRPSPAVDPATVRVTFEYIASAVVWLLIGTAGGLIASIKLHWPEFLPVSWLAFGRLRPFHTSAVLFGWSSLAMIGLALYVVSRTSRTPLWRPNLARLALWLCNATLLGALVTMLAGITRGPQEYREWAWPFAAVLAVAVVIDGLVAYRTVAARKLPEIYVSNWYILGAFCWLAILYVTGYLPFYQGGLGNTVVQGYYMHNAVGMWFTQLALGITYYAIPRLLGRPDLLLRARRARLLDQPALLPVDRRPPFHLQPGPVVAPEHGDPLQRRDDGAGVGGHGEPAADLPRLGQRRVAQLRAAVLRRRPGLLRAGLHPGHVRGLPHGQPLPRTSPTSPSVTRTPRCTASSPSSCGAPSTG